MEKMAYGGTLEKARVWHLGRLKKLLKPGDRVLLIGDGDGRFFQQLASQAPECDYTYLEMSQVMIKVAKKRLPQEAINVDWLHGGAEKLEQLSSDYTLVTTHFILDCYDGPELEQLVRLISSKLRTEGYWLHSDFDAKASWWARWLVAIMYLFFRIVSGLKKKNLSRPDSLLEREGLTLREKGRFWRGFIYSDLWKKMEK